MSGTSDRTRESLVSSRKVDAGGVLLGVRDSGPGLAPELPAKPGARNQSRPSRRLLHVERYGRGFLAHLFRADHADGWKELPPTSSCNGGAMRSCGPTSAHQGCQPGHRSGGPRSGPDRRPHHSGLSATKSPGVTRAIAVDIDPAVAAGHLSATAYLLFAAGSSVHHLYAVRKWWNPLHHAFA
jgi:hypothetical protein